MAYTPTYYEKDGVIRLARTQSEAIALRFAGWSVFAGDININPQGKVVSFNGRSGVVTLTAADILATGFAGGASDAESIRDTIGIALQGTGLITVTVDDDGNMLTVSTAATQNSTDATLLNRTNHTGTQSADTIVDGTTNHTFTAADDTKLTGIATGATANSTDTFLRARTNHTGTQLAATISDFNTAVSGAISGAGYAPSADPTFTGLTTISGFRLGQLSKSADYTVAANDPSYIAVATGAGNVTITLPAAAPAGTIFIIKKTDGNGGNVTISANTDAFTIPSLNSQYDVMGLISTGAGSNYSILFSNKPVRIQASTTDLGTVLSNLGMRTSGSAYPITTSGAVSFSNSFTASGGSTITGNVRFGQRGLAAATTLNLSSDPLFINCDATTAGFNVTLPSTNTAGYMYYIKKTDATANAVTVVGTNIDGASSIILQTLYDWVCVVSTGTAGTWRILGQLIKQASTTELGQALAGAGFRGAGTAYPLTTSGAVTLSGTTVLSGTTTISNLRMNGGRASNVNTATANYTVGIGAVELQMCDATTAAFTATLPATTNIGNVFTFKKTDATTNAVTIAAGTSIDGAASIVLANKDDWVTVISSGTTGIWRIIARSTPNLLPSYLVTPSVLRKNFDPSTGLYNFNARTMRRARAGLGKAAAGGFMRVLCMGDSTLVGFDGSTTSEQGSYPRRLGAFLSQFSGAPLGGGMVPWTVNTTSMVSTGTVDRQAYPGLMTMYPGSTVTYTSVLPFTSHDLTYSNQSATFGVQIDGGAAVNPAVTGAGTMTKATTHTGLANTVHTIKLTAGSNYAYIALSDLKQASGIQISNIAVSGTTADLITTGVTSWANTAAAPTLKTSLVDGYQTLAGYDPDLIVIAIGGNDLYNGDTNAHAIAGAKKMKDYFPNASCLMVQGWRLGIVPAATANDYLERKYNLADQYDFALHDFQHVSGTYEEATALGVVGGDTVHPSFGSLSQWGRSSAQALAAA